ncbi:MAG TPA: rod shape-determining protein MreD [Gemmatimonadales bacterium]|nr:rod shape-determining protein MreD [Gemmatimonadales bacterium]
MIILRSDRRRLLLALGLLLLLHFTLRPRLGHPESAPDFLLLALLVFSIRSRPGSAAVMGFIIGVLGDSLTPARFGAGALAHTVVGYLTAWGRAVFFADNLMVNGAVFFAGTWLRNLIVLMASGGLGDGLVRQLLIWSPLQSLTTAISGAIFLSLFRRWLDIRLEE